MKRCLLPILIVLALAAPATAAATTFGASVGSEFILQSRSQWTAGQVVNSLKKLYKAGGRVGTADSNWAGAEPKAPVHGHHTYNWAYDDVMVTEMAQAHLRLEPNLELAPKWAEAHRPNVLHLQTGRFVVPLPPAKNSNYAAYAKAFMKRYGVHGSFWAANRRLHYVPITTVEVWNEPDNTHNWGPQINLHDYMRMYEAVRTAVHRVNRHARVSTGGLAWTPSSLPRFLKAFRGRAIDALAVHPYGPNPRRTISVAKFARSEMRRARRGRTPVIVNEYGWTSTRDTWGTTRARNVKPYAYQALIGLAKLGLSEIIPYQWASPTWGLSNGSLARAVAKVNHHR
jgi:hypothetical protein